VDGPNPNKRGTNEPPHEATLRFKFVRRDTGQPISIPWMQFTFFDFDETIHFHFMQGADIGPPAQRRAVHKVRQRWKRGNPNMRGLATRASWASTCLAGASRVELLLLYAESPPATYFGDAICARRRHLGSAAVSAVPDHGECKT